NFLNLKEINKYEALKVGYHIVTSPYSKNFPENIPIGTIEKIEKNSKETYYRIRVRSAVNFGKIQSVYIVLDMFKDEIEKLERKVEEQQKKGK
ncbi:MAG: rod shape-determining protein MreC, partial [Bacteroidia bacterium]|nr:rod shape-determining protein MreC [Bacteroidia bacterium]